MIPMSVTDHLQPGEQIIYEARPSRVPLVPAAFLAVVFAIAALIAWMRLAPPGQIWAAGLCGAVAAAALIMLLVGYMRLSANRYVLTDRRILRLTGIFGRSSMDSYLDKINNVEHRQTFMGRLLGYVDLEIDTAAGAGAEVFPFISDPLSFKRAIDAATGSFHTAGRVPGTAPASAAPDSGADKIRQLKKLLDDGLISEAEFNVKRKQILDQI
jgi:membrane protein YdbS with pleckstrin-like domain